MLLAPVIFLAMNGCAWRAYMSARTEGQVNPCMSFFLDPSKMLGRPFAPGAFLSPKEQFEVAGFWWNQEERAAQLWLDVLDPFVRYLVYFEPDWRSCFGDVPAMRLKWTLNGWKVAEFTFIRVRGWAILERNPSLSHVSKSGEEVVVRDASTHLWVRMW